MSSNNYYVSVCRVCGMSDTRCGSYDGAEWCSECYSVEQGFLFTDEFDCSLRLVVDEDGLIYVDGSELDGPVACEI